MREVFQDMKELKKMEETRYHKLGEFFESFYNDFHGKVDVKYIELIKNLELKIRNVDLPSLNLGYQEYYHRDINFSSLGDNFFRLIWDIELAKSVIKDKKVPIKKIPVRDLIDIVDETGLSLIKLKKAKLIKKPDPIIIASYNPLNSFMIIDGNHRVYTREKYQLIDAYILDDFTSLECMAGKIFKCFYAIHFNATKIMNYTVDPSTVGNLDKILIDIY